MIEFFMVLLTKGWPLFVTMAVKGTVLLIIAFSLILVMRRSAATRHFIASVALTGLLLIPLLVVALPSWPLTPAIPAKLFPEPAASVTAEQQASDLTNVPVRIDSTIGPYIMPKMVMVGTIFFGSWTLVALIVLSRFWLGLAAIRRLEKHDSQIVESGALYHLNHELSRRLDIKRPVTLRMATSPSMRMPMTWGFKRPTVLLPAEATEWPDEKLRSVLFHELGHVQRGDWLMQNIATTVCALYWFHPLVWLMAARLRAESERATDDVVLAAGVKPSEYSKHLLDLSLWIGETQTKNRLARSSVPMVRGAIEKRLARLLDAHEQRRALSRSEVWICAGVLGVVVSAAATYQNMRLPLPLVQMPKIASFDGGEFTPANPATAKAQAQEIIAKCRAASAAVKSFEGILRTSDVQIRDGKPETKGGIEEIAFAKPWSMHILGKDEGGSAYEVIDTKANGYWIRPINQTNNWGLATNPSNTSNTTFGPDGMVMFPYSTIKMMLQGEDSKRTFHNREAAKLDGEVKIGARTYYRISVARPTATGIWWIDKETLLIRRYSRIRTMKQAIEMRDMIEKRSRAVDKKYGFQPIKSPDTLSLGHTEDFEIKSLNQPIDESLFAEPDL